MKPLASLLVCLVCLAPPAASQEPAADTGDVFMEKVVEEKPEILSAPQLHYPDLMRQAKVEDRPTSFSALMDPSGGDSGQTGPI